MDIVKLITLLLAIIDKIFGDREVAKNEENGAAKVTVAGQKEIIADVEIAHHVEYDVPIDGALADFVRSRSAKRNS